MEGHGCTRAAIVLSCAFLLIFTSYGGIESLETSIIPGSCKDCRQGQGGVCQFEDICQDKSQFSCDVACAAPFQECQSTLGNTILGVVYLAFTLSAFFGPVVPNYLGMKWSLFGSSFFYALFAFANLVVVWTPGNENLHEIVMITAAVFLGLSASVLWISQASYLTQLSTIYAILKNDPIVSSMGVFNGIFFGIFNMSGITGNLISSLVLSSFGWSKNSLFIIYTVLGLCGTGLFVFLPILPPLASLNGAHEGTNSLTPAFSAHALWKITKDRRMIILIPVFLFGGLLRGFAMGEFTSNFVRESLGGPYIGYIMALYGAVTVFGSYGFGKLTDKFGPLLGQCIGYTSLFIAYCICYWIEVSKCDEQWLLVSVIAVLLSIGDATSSTLTNVVIGQEFPHDAVNAFSIVKAYQSGATAASFFFFKLMSYHARLAFLMGTVLLAASTFVVYTKKYRQVGSA